MDKLKDIHALIDTWGHEECIKFLKNNGGQDTNSNNSSIWRLREHCKHVASIEFSERLKTSK